MLIRTATCLLLTVVMLTGCSAGGGCEDRVDAIVARGEQDRYPDALENDLTQLRDAALVFQQRGQDTECADIANGMDELLDDYTRTMQARHERAARKAYLRGSRPVTAINGVIKSEQVIGAPVRNLKDQELGAIENVAFDLDTGHIAYVALSTGGFLGLGAKLVAIPWQRFNLTKDRALYVLDLSLEKLDKIQGFDAERWPTQAVNENPARAQPNRSSAPQPSESR